MKYEKPELTALTPAISAIQLTGDKSTSNSEDNNFHVSISCYEDNE